jgi:hypothetical protein
VAYGADPAYRNLISAKVVTYEFDPQRAFVRRDVLDLGSTASAVRVRGGQLNHDFGRPDQAILLRTDPGVLELLDFDRRLNVTRIARLDVPDLVCPADLAIGRFDRAQANPQPPPDRTQNPNLQAAVLWQPDCRSQALQGAISIYDIDPGQSPRLAVASSHTFEADLPVNGRFMPMQLAAGDTQGRSLILGDPQTVTLSRYSQPSFVIGAPPMHADFVSVDGMAAPEVFNVSLVPAGFFTSFQLEEQTGRQSSVTGTTSWSVGVAGKAGGKVVVGNPEATNYTVSTEVAAQEVWEGIEENFRQQYAERSIGISQRTGASDQVWFTDSQVKLYIYPVLGQQACPKDSGGGPGCPEDKKAPLYVQFSGSAISRYVTVEGATLEWYQPPWEPGNVLSYPASEARLREIFPTMDSLSGIGKTWFTDTSGGGAQWTWKTGTSQETSIGTNETFSLEIDVSASGQFSWGPEIGAVAGHLDVGTAYNNATASLNTQQTLIGKTTGLGLDKPGSFPTPVLYQYGFTPQIFGQVRPAANINDQPALSADLTTFGPLRAAYVVDPLSEPAGGWWQQVYTQAPDVALNHPARWTLTSGTSDGKNCRSVASGTSEAQCLSKAESHPENPWLSPFHYMRGFFISYQDENGKGTSANRRLAQGSQIDRAIAGDRLLLQARVYNYSLAPMPLGTRVHVRFYGQPWDSRTNRPDGQSILIGEDQLGVIPPFSRDGPLNWSLAQASFDTTPYPNRYFTFWVVVWMENAGKLVEEMPGHGLTAIPGHLTSLPGTPLTEEHSNNIGFYKRSFYIVAKSAAARARSSADGAQGSFPAAPIRSLPAEAKPTGKRPNFRLGGLRISSTRISSGQAVEVETRLMTGSHASPGAVVLFYDGNPRRGGELIDVEELTYLRPRGRYDVSILLPLLSCGVHNLFAVATEGAASQTTGRRRVVVRCEGE